MPISLPPDAEQLVAQQVATGKYPNAEAFVSAAVKWYIEYREQLRAELQAKLDHSLAQIERGECSTYDDEGLKKFFAEMEAEVDAELAAERRDAS